MSLDSRAVGCRSRGFCLIFEMKMVSAVEGVWARASSVWAGCFTVLCGVGELVPDIMLRER